MVGVGKLLKQAQKMQQKMEEAQALLSEEIIEVSGGGGAVSIKISGQGEFKELKLDPEFLKEDAEFVSEAILQSIVDASEQAKRERRGDERTCGRHANARSLLAKGFLTPRYEQLVQLLKGLPGLGTAPRENRSAFTCRED